MVYKADKLFGFLTITHKTITVCRFKVIFPVNYIHLLTDFRSTVESTDEVRRDVHL